MIDVIGSVTLHFVKTKAGLKIKKHRKDAHRNAEWQTIIKSVNIFLPSWALMWLG